jgi:threonine dehydratase
MAGGLAVWVPDPAAPGVIRRGAADHHGIGGAEIRRAMSILFTGMHNVAQSPLAAALQERSRLAGKRVAVIQSGGNIGRGLFAEVLAEEDAP